METFKVIGYYICEVVETPEWLHGIGKQMLSVSGCLGEQHPKWECFLGGWCKDESQEYQKRLRNDEQYQEFSEAANRLFDLGRIDGDSRFLRLSDAQYFCEKFCSALTCRVVSVSTIPEYFEILSKELKGGQSHGQMNGEIDSSSWIGSDILGWDIGGFHSFLCNSLQESLLTAKFNNIGLLENEFQNVIHYAKQIKGLGEPVEWIPCKVGDPCCGKTADSGEP